MSTYNKDSILAFDVDGLKECKNKIPYFNKLLLDRIIYLTKIKFVGAKRTFTLNSDNMVNVDYDKLSIEDIDRFFSTPYVVKQDLLPILFVPWLLVNRDFVSKGTGELQSEQYLTLINKLQNLLTDDNPVVDLFFITLLSINMEDYVNNIVKLLGYNFEQAAFMHHPEIDNIIAKRIENKEKNETTALWYMMFLARGVRQDSTFINSDEMDKYARIALAKGTKHIDVICGLIDADERMFNFIIDNFDVLYARVNLNFKDIQERINSYLTPGYCYPIPLDNINLKFFISNHGLKDINYKVSRHHLIRHGWTNLYQDRVEDSNTIDIRCLSYGKSISIIRKFLETSTLDVEKLLYDKDGKKLIQDLLSFSVHYQLDKFKKALMFILATFRATIRV